MHGGDRDIARLAVEARLHRDQQRRAVDSLSGLVAGGRVADGGPADEGPLDDGELEGGAGAVDP